MALWQSLHLLYPQPKIGDNKLVIVANVYVSFPLIMIIKKKVDFVGGAAFCQLSRFRRPRPHYSTLCFLIIQDQYVRGIPVERVGVVRMVGGRLRGEM